MTAGNELSGHPVLGLIAERIAAGSRPGARADSSRLALVIEGGGMRGTLTAGMALMLHELGLTPAFDDVYGSSAGAITGAWLCSADPAGMRIWIDGELTRALIRPGNLLRPGRPVLDVETLIEQVYPRVMDFGSVLASPVRLHVLATDVETGTSTDLRPYQTSALHLRLAIRASCAMPVLAGPAVELAGRRYLDSGLSESVPYRTAQAQGATHVLVLSARPAADNPRPSWAVSSRLLAATVLRRYPQQLRRTFLTRGDRLAASETPLRDGHPAIYPIRPAPGGPQVRSRTRDPVLLCEGFEAGRAAAAVALAACFSHISRG